MALEHDLPAHNLLSFAFKLRNPNTLQGPPAILIGCLQRGGDHGSPSPGHAWQIPRAKMDLGVGNGAPLLVTGFEKASIAQQTPGALLNNTLRVALRMRAALPPGSGETFVCVCMCM